MSAASARTDGGRPVRSGAVAGAVAALAFAAVHAVFISDIWFSALPMAVAGAGCGACLAWTHTRVVAVPSIRSWVGFNLMFVLLFGLLGAASVAVFEPQSTIAALIAADEPPGELIARAMPLTAGFTLAATGLVLWLYGNGWRDLGPILVTTVVLVVTLGLNVSVIGLVDIPVGSLHLIAELYGLIVVLAAVHTAVFAALEQHALGQAAGSSRVKAWPDA